MLLMKTSFPGPLPELHPDTSALSGLVNSVEVREPHLMGHGARTTWYALQLGRAIDLSEQDLIHLTYAAYLHDVGKLSIPEAILIKQAPLSSQEYHRLQSHPRAAMTLLQSWPFLRIPSIWIAHHHERWDGSGYPNGLKGTYIPIGSRIIAIADAYDVMNLRNMDSPVTDSENCLSTLRWYSGAHFDPELIDTFSQLASEWAAFRERNVGLDGPPATRNSSHLIPSPNQEIIYDSIRHDTPSVHRLKKENTNLLQGTPGFLDDNVIAPG